MRISLGNLDPEIDEKYLYDTFSAFGVILQTPKIMRDPDTGISKGIAFINFASFEASDSAMEALNGQFLSNRSIRVSYSFKKDGKGERHGTASERLLASRQPVIFDDRPHQHFSDSPSCPIYIPSHLHNVVSEVTHRTVPLSHTNFSTSTSNISSPFPILPLRQPTMNTESQFSFPISNPHTLIPLNTNENNFFQDSPYPQNADIPNQVFMWFLFQIKFLLINQYLLMYILVQF